MSLKKSANADEVYNAVVKKIGMSKKVSSFFYLFEIVEYNFGKTFSRVSAIDFAKLIFFINFREETPTV